jgi:acyl-CoA thioester hydrolase
MFSHEYQKRVRYGETDRMGYLYYGCYANYYEIGRVEMLRSLGLSYKDMEEKEGIMLPVASLEMRFVRPALYDELLTIRTTLRRLPEKEIVFHMEIFNEQGKVFVNMKTKKTMGAPEYLLERLRGYFRK